MDFAMLVFTDINQLRQSANWTYRRRIEGLHKHQAFKILLYALRDLQYDISFRRAIVCRLRTRKRIRVDWQKYYSTLLATRKKPYINKTLKMQLDKLLYSRRFLWKLRRRYRSGEFRVIYNF